MSNINYLGILVIILHYAPKTFTANIYSFHVFKTTTLIYCLETGRLRAMLLHVVFKSTHVRRTTESENRHFATFRAI